MQARLGATSTWLSRHTLPAQASLQKHRLEQLPRLLIHVRHVRRIVGRLQAN